MSNQFQIPDVMQIGDIVAVNGRGWISTLTKLFSQGVSHVEIVAHNPASGELECFSADEHGARFMPIEQVMRETNGGKF